MRSPRAIGPKVSGRRLEVARRYRPRFPQRADSKRRPLPLRQYERRPFSCSEVSEDAGSRLREMQLAHHCDQPVPMRDPNLRAQKSSSAGYRAGMAY